MDAPCEVLERILVDLSSRFARVEAGRVRPEIEHGLEVVAKFLHAESYGLIEPLGGAESPWITTFRTPQGTSPFDAWPESFLRDLHEAQLGGLVMRRSDPAPPPQSRQERPLAPGPDPRASIAVPICLGGRVLGALSFDSYSSTTLASPEHEEQLRSIAGVFAHGLQRKRLEEQLGDSLAFEQLLVQLTAILSRAPPSGMQSALAAAVQHLAQALRLDQVVLLDLASGAEEPRTICGYNGAASPVVPAFGTQLKNLNDRLLLGEVIRVVEGRVLGVEESTPVDVPLVLLLPLAISGAALCAVGSATRRDPWGQPERMLPRLCLAGEIFASAWARMNTLAETAASAASAERAAAPPVERSLRVESVYARERLTSEHVIEGVIGRSDLLRYVLFKVDQVARTDATTLLLGETGTGKGLIARAIHELSARRGRAMVTVNCAALPNGLVETELFGHEKGSYTGAHRSQAGRFEVANGSTILLDEIGDLPLELQPKLLRILQEGELERVGSTKTLKLDVRVIAATNRNLEEEMRQGRFREDLYYRLNVFPITLPTLRERRDDIPFLVQHIVERLSLKLGKTIERIPKVVMEALQAHTWPGNVRELESVLTQALIVTNDATLRLANRFAPPKDTLTAHGTELSEVERAHISQTLIRHDWRIEGRRGAAAALGMNPSTLRGRMRKLSIQRPTT